MAHPKQTSPNHLCLPPFSSDTSDLCTRKGGLLNIHYILNRELALLLPTIPYRTTAMPPREGKAAEPEAAPSDESTVQSKSVMKDDSVMDSPLSPVENLQRMAEEMQNKLRVAKRSLASVEESLPAMKKAMTKMQSTLDAYITPSARDSPGDSQKSPYFDYTGESQKSPTTDPGDSQTSTTTTSSSVSSKSNPNPRRSSLLAVVAAETQSVLPALLRQMPHAKPDGHLYCNYTPDGLRFPALSPQSCPRIKGPKIRVVNSDTIDAALDIASKTRSTTSDVNPVVILNLASEYRAGGGWLKGALAQEEALCYRSSLIFTLKLRYYPLPTFSAIYSPTIAIIRQSLASGHQLLDLSNPSSLPILSAISLAALRHPVLTKGVPPKYRNPQDRECMKEKMRVVLRVATGHGHRRLVLGALGCGAFMNPKEEVAECWREIFAEPEFKGGWWEEVVFAVLDDGIGKGNFGVFTDVLDRIEIGA
jgi:uncharacterized protein (TIGR02452 family)